MIQRRIAITALTASEIYNAYLMKGRFFLYYSDVSSTALILFFVSEEFKLFTPRIRKIIRHCAILGTSVSAVGYHMLHGLPKTIHWDLWNHGPTLLYLIFDNLLAHRDYAKKDWRLAVYFSGGYTALVFLYQFLGFRKETGERWVYDVYNYEDNPMRALCWAIWWGIVGPVVGHYLVYYAVELTNYIGDNIKDYKIVKFLKK